MAKPRILKASEAAGLIPDSAIVTVSSSSALGCPDAVLAAVGARFDAEGRPRNLTTLHPIAAGDMWGGERHRPYRQAGLPRPHSRRLLPFRVLPRPSLRPFGRWSAATSSLLQRPLGHSV